MKILRYLAGAVIPALTFSSCLGSGEEARNEATYNYGGEACFNYVTDLETDESSIFDGPRYTLKYDFTDAMVGVEISGLKYSDELSQVSFKLPELPVKVDNSGFFYLTDQRNITPENAMQGNYVFNSFTLRCNPTRLLRVNGSYRSFPVYLVNYVINNRYEITTFPVQGLYIGTTNSYAVVAEGETATSFRTKDNLYTIVIDYKKMTAAIQIVDCEFAENMPRQSFMIKDLPIKINNGGFTILPDPDTTYKLYNTSDKVVENCSISNIKVASTLTSGITAINFHLDLSGLSSTSFDFGKYDVVTNLAYFIKEENNGNGSGN